MHLFGWRKLVRKVHLKEQLICQREKDGGNGRCHDIIGKISGPIHVHYRLEDV